MGTSAGGDSTSAVADAGADAEVEVDAVFGDSVATGVTVLGDAAGGLATGVACTSFGWQAEKSVEARNRNDARSTCIAVN